MNITQCSFCKNKKTQWSRSTIAPVYFCKCGGYTAIVVDFKASDRTGMHCYLRKWVKG
jgi:hypothetical protein